MVSSINSGAYSAEALRTRVAADRFVDLKSQLEDLSRQLSTGKISDDWSGLGPQRITSLDFNATINRLDGYASNINDAQTRLKLMDQTLTALDKNRSEAISALTLDSYALRSGGTTQGKIMLEGRFNEMIDFLNLDVAGRYVFSGRATDTRPVASADTILNGAGGRTGLVQAIANQRTTDQVTAMGGLTTGVSGTTVTVTNGTGGFTVSGANSFDFSTPPTSGQVYKLSLTLSDGTTETVSLTATNGTPVPGVSFAIDPVAGTTASNFRTSLNAALDTAARTSLSAASAMKASRDFFVNGTVPNQVQWYLGDTATPARDTAQVRASDGSPIATGAAANEDAFKNLFANYAVMAAETFSASDPNTAARYDALKARISNGLSEPTGQKVRDIATDLGVAAADIAAAGDRNKTAKSLLQTRVDDIENATPEEVAAQLLSLQTQLQASYQITASIAKLSLVNYLG